MRYVIRHRPDTQTWRTEPDDQLMERLDWNSFAEAVNEIEGTMRVGDTIELVSDGREETIRCQSIRRIQRDMRGEVKP